MSDQVENLKAFAENFGSSDETVVPAVSDRQNVWWLYFYDLEPRAMPIPCAGD